MLSLTRGTGDVIMVGDTIRLTVVAVENGAVRFGIDAPREIPVHREEVWERICDEAEAGVSRPVPNPLG